MGRNSELEAQWNTAQSLSRYGTKGRLPGVAGDLNVTERVASEARFPNFFPAGSAQSVSIHRFFALQCYAIKPAVRTKPLPVAEHDLGFGRAADFQPAPAGEAPAHVKNEYARLRLCQGNWLEGPGHADWFVRWRDEFARWRSDDSCRLPVDIPRVSL